MRQTFLSFLIFFLVGDIVGLYDVGGCHADSQISTGIVTRVSQASVSVAFEDSKDGLSFDTDCLYNLLKLANDVTYKRMKKWVTSVKWYSTKHMRCARMKYETLEPPCFSVCAEPWMHWIDTAVDQSPVWLMFSLGTLNLRLTHSSVSETYQKQVFWFSIKMHLIAGFTEVKPSTEMNFALFLLCFCRWSTIL